LLEPFSSFFIFSILLCFALAVCFDYYSKIPFVLFCFLQLISF
jgi:hypothetical protein